jgi:hypothetical protein
MTICVVQPTLLAPGGDVRITATNYDVAVRTVESDE